jgi:hypothetical protein
MPELRRAALGRAGGLLLPREAGGAVADRRRGGRRSFVAASRMEQDEEQYKPAQLEAVNRSFKGKVRVALHIYSHSTA